MDEIKNKEIIGKSTDSAIGKEIDLKKNTKLNEPISQKIIRNTIFNTIGRFWGILVALFLTPYIIGHIGVDRFGIWAIVGVLTGYFGLLDFGIGTSFVKYISEFYAKENYKKINQVVNTGFIFYSIFAVSIVILGLFIINPLLNFFSIPSNLHSEASFVFLVGVALFSISNALSVFGAVQTGLQRMDIANKVAIAISIPNIIGTIFFLERGYGLPGLMVNNAIILAISSIINIIVAFKILPELRFNPFLFISRRMLKRLFGFGYKLQTSRIASLFHFQLDKILLAYFLNVGFVAYYTVAANLASRARGIPLMLTSAILPAASELEAKTNKSALYELYFRSMKYIVLIGLPFSLLVILLANPFMDLWLGKGYARSALTLQLLTIGYFFNVMTGPGFFILNGVGKPQYGMRSSILAAILNLVLSTLLVIKIGYFGVVVGTVISMIIAAGYFITMFHSVMNISLLNLWFRLLSKPLIACGIATLPLYCLKEIYPINNWANLVGIGALYTGVFLAILLVMKCLDSYDRNLIGRYLSAPIFRKAIKSARYHKLSQ